MQNWLGPDRLYKPQGHGDLGEKLKKAFGDAFAAGAQRVVTIGCDCPGLSRKIVGRAFDALYMKDLVTEAPVLKGFGKTRVIDEHTIEVDVPDTLSLNDLIRQLDAQNFIVERMRNKANRLEELFIAMTAKPEKNQ